MSKILVFSFLFSSFYGIHAQKNVLFTPAYLSDLKSVEVRKLYTSSSGVIWIGTKGQGIYRWRENQLEKLSSTEEGIMTGFIAIMEDQEGSMWFGARGLMSVKGNQWRPVSGEQSSTVIFSFTRDKKGRLYAGGNKGMHRCSKEGQWIDMAVNEQLSHPVVHDLIIDKRNIWAATRKAGLNYFKKGKLVGSYLTETNCRKLLQLKNGDVLIGTNSGLFSINAKEELENLYPNKLLFPEFEDEEGQIWCSSEQEGLYRFDGTDWWRMTQKGNSNSHHLFSIIESGNEIWLGTKSGIVRLRKGDIEWEKLSP